MCKLKLTKLRSLVLSSLVSLWMASSASAMTVSFALTDFLVSTTTTNIITNCVDLTCNPRSAPALPADATFTIPADRYDHYSPTNPSNTSYLAENQGKFLRFNFNLPTGFHDLAFTFNALVNDEFALYVNDTVVAIQGSTGIDNFYPPLPGFSMNTAGTATDTSDKLEYLLTSGIQPLFQAGTNELTLFGTDTLIYGGFHAINGTITFVPVPAAVWLFISGLGALAGKRLRAQSRVHA